MESDVGTDVGGPLQVRVVALPVVHWGTGIVIDVKAVRDKLKSTHGETSS